MAGALEGLISTAHLHLALGVASPFLVSFTSITNVFYAEILYAGYSETTHGASTELDFFPSANRREDSQGRHTTEYGTVCNRCDRVRESFAFSTYYSEASMVLALAKFPVALCPCFAIRCQCK